MIDELLVPKSNKYEGKKELKDKKQNFITHRLFVYLYNYPKESTDRLSEQIWECYGIEEHINNIQKPLHQRVIKDYNFKNPIQKVINPNRDLEINKK